MTNSEFNRKCAEIHHGQKNPLVWRRYNESLTLMLEVCREMNIIVEMFIYPNDMTNVNLHGDKAYEGYEQPIASTEAPTPTEALRKAMEEVLSEKV